VNLAPSTYNVTVSVLFAEGVRPNTAAFDASVRAWSAGTRDVLPNRIGVSTARAPNPNTQLVDTTPRESAPARKRFRLTSNIVVVVQQDTLRATLATLAAQAVLASGVEVDVGALARAFDSGVRIVSARIDTATMTLRAATTAPRVTPARPTTAPASGGNGGPAPVALAPAQPVAINPPAPVPVTERLAGAVVVDASDPSAVGAPPPTSSTVHFALIAAAAILAAGAIAYVVTRKSS